MSEKLQVLLDYLDKRVVDYEIFEDYVRVYFTDVFEALGINWRCRDWDELAEILNDFSKELEKATGWRRDSDEWYEDADGWIFYVSDGVEDGE